MRPVSASGTGEVNRHDCGLDPYPAEFDVVSFAHRGHDGDATQPENLVIDGSPWTLESSMAPADAEPLLDLVLHGDDRLFGNRGKAVHIEDTAGGVLESLCVVEPDDVAFCLTDAHKLRVRFRHGGGVWDLGLTDYLVSPVLRARAPGTYSLPDLGFPPAPLSANVW